MVNYENDYNWGEAQQRKIYKYLGKKWNGLISQGRWSKYDFISDEVNMEVKSRKNKYDAYPTTLLTCNKIADTSKTNVFVFNFVYDRGQDLSEIYYIEYDEEKFKTYQTAMFSRANIKTDEKMYLYIPIEYLTFLYRESPSLFKEIGLEKPVNVAMACI